MAPELQEEFINMLTKDNVSLRKAGNELAIAALHVANEYDGVHRLMLAVSEWTSAIANEGGRSKGRGTAVMTNERV